MYGDDEVKKSWTEIDDNVIKEVCRLLHNYNYDILNNMIYFVSSLCNISPYDMLSINDKVYASQSRWLLWYAHRYMTNESYERIAEYTHIEGHRFRTRSVAAGIEKMSQLIEQEPIWCKRWGIIKQIIKTWRKESDILQKSKEIVVNIPKELDVKLKIKQI